MPNVGGANVSVADIGGLGDIAYAQANRESRTGVATTISSSATRYVVTVDNTPLKYALNFTSASDNGVVTYTGSRDIIVCAEYDAQLYSVSGAPNFYTCLMVNGAMSGSLEENYFNSGTSAARQHSRFFTAQISNGDTVALGVRNPTDTTNLGVYALDFKVYGVKYA